MKSVKDSMLLSRYRSSFWHLQRSRNEVQYGVVDRPLEFRLNIFDDSIVLSKRHLRVVPLPI